MGDVNHGRRHAQKGEEGGDSNKVPSFSKVGDGILEAGGQALL
jgi:hypothetical protein